MHSDQSWYVPLLYKQQWPNVQCYRSRWVGGAFGLKPDLPPRCAAVASAYHWLSKVKWGEYFQHTWKCLHTTQSPRWNEVSHWKCSAHLEMSSMCIKAQRCKKRQIWQIYLYCSFQGGANFVSLCMDRNENWEHCSVLLTILGTIILHHQQN